MTQKPEQKTEKNTPLKEITLGNFLAKLGSGSATPGGGSAAALSACLGAALVSMVCNLTLGNEKYAEFKPLALATAARAEALERDLLDCAQRDIAAFDGVMTALRLPRETEPQREERARTLQAALKAAVLPPLDLVRGGLAVMRLAKELLGRSNKNAASDLAVAATQAYAGVVGGAENAAVNLLSIKDAPYVAAQREALRDAEAEGARLLEDVRRGVAEMLLG